MAAFRPCAPRTRPNPPSVSLHNPIIGHASKVRIRRPPRVSRLSTATRPPRSRRRIATVRAAEGSGKAVDVETQSAELLFDAEDRMSKAVDSVANGFSTLRTGRANPGILSRIEVDYYGAPTPLASLAGVSVPDGATLLVTPYDKTTLEEIERALLTADLGITPSNDGERIWLRVPALTEERRKEMAKKVGKMGEDGKVAVRNVRRDVLKSGGKLGMAEDELKAFEDEVQKVTKECVGRIDKMVTEKEKELTTL